MLPIVCVMTSYDSFINAWLLAFYTSREVIMCKLVFPFFTQINLFLIIFILLYQMVYDSLS